jgi:XisI protein
MDKLEKYRQIVQKIVAVHGQYKSSQPEIESLTICDRQHDNYLLMGAGWNKTGRVHNIVLHLRIREGKIWIEWDGIEEGVTQELLEAGVLPQDIVLAFYPPEMRVNTGFAVA